MGNQEGSKKKFYKKWWFWAIVVIVLYAIGSSSSKPNNTQPTQEPVNTQSNQTKTEEVVAKVTALQLYSEYEANEVAADSKYKNKLIEVSGTISNIGKDVLDNPYVTLQGDSTTFFSVQCMFKKSQQEQLTSLSKDTEISLKGRVSGKMMNIIINDCSIVE